MNFPFHCSESCLFVIIGVFLCKLKEKLVYCFIALAVCFNSNTFITVAYRKIRYCFVAGEKDTLFPFCFYVTVKVIFAVNLSKTLKLFLGNFRIGKVYFFTIIIIIIYNKTFGIKKVRVVFNPCPKAIAICTVHMILIN